jgi:hypothetical protein
MNISPTAQKITDCLVPSARKVLAYEKDIILSEISPLPARVVARGAYDIGVRYTPKWLGFGINEGMNYFAKRTLGDVAADLSAHTAYFGTELHESFALVAEIERLRDENARLRSLARGI